MKKIEVQYVDESMLESRRLADALVLGAGRRRDENDAISTDKEHFALTFNHLSSRVRVERARASESKRTKRAWHNMRS